MTALWYRHRVAILGAAAIITGSTVAALLVAGWYVPLFDFVLDVAQEFGAIASFVAAVVFAMLWSVSRFDAAVLRAERDAERRANALLRSQLAEHVDVHDAAWARLRREVEDARGLL